jgi:hypothetical protein
VAAEFLKIFQVPGQDRYKVKVRWWNIGRCHAPWCMNLTQNMDLTGEQMRKFRPYRFEENPTNINAAGNGTTVPFEERRDEIE